MPSLNQVPELVQAARSGSAAAWNALYQQYYPGLYTIALRMCGSVPAARDAVQETFILAYLKLSQLKDAATFGGWIRKILTHYCYRDSHRNRLTTRLEGIPFAGDGWWEDELNRRYDWLSAQNQLYTALAQLPEVLRSTLLLRYFSSFHSYEQMAAILCVPVGTIRSRLNQAKVKLTQEWQQFSDVGRKLFIESEEWNGFYQAIYSGLHTDDACKNKLMNHLQKDIQIISNASKPITGGVFFERKVHEDRQVGSWLKPDQVTSCGNISIVEVSHYNSPEHPYHCPSHSVAVLYRHKGKVGKMHLYTSPQ